MNSLEGTDRYARATSIALRRIDMYAAVFREEKRGAAESPDAGLTAFALGLIDGVKTDGLLGLTFSRHFEKDAG